MSQCAFDKSWSGRCSNTALVSSPMCEEHARLVCKSCGAPATHECDHTGIQFVCGAPLCDNCAHAPPPPGEGYGMFNLGGSHKVKSLADQEWAVRFAADEAGYLAARKEK